MQERRKINKRTEEQDYDVRETGRKRGRETIQLKQSVCMPEFSETNFDEISDHLL